MESRKAIRIVIGWLLAVVIIFILLRIIYVNRQELSQWQWHIYWPEAITSIFLLAGAYLTACQAWRTIVYGFGHCPKFHDSFRIVYLANLGRYVPGKVWQVFGMVALASEVGIPARISLASFALAQAYSLPASFLLIPVFLGKLDSVKSLDFYRDIIYAVFAVSLLIFLFFFFKPDGLNRILNWLLRLFRRESVNYSPDLKNRVSIFLWYLITWTLFGFAFHYFLAALLDNPSIEIKYAIGTYIAAYIIGYISFIAPAGLGPREGVITALLAPFLGLPVAVSISFIHRVWITIAEAIISLSALLTYRIKSPKNVSKSE